MCAYTSVSVSGRRREKSGRREKGAWGARAALGVAYYTCAQKATAFHTSFFYFLAHAHAPCE